MIILCAAIGLFAACCIAQLVEYLALRRLRKDRDKLLKEEGLIPREEISDYAERIAKQAIAEMQCAYRTRGYGCNLCYQADVVEERLGMDSVYCVVQDSDCAKCTRAFSMSTCTKDWYDKVIQSKGGETE